MSMSSAHQAPNESELIVLLSLPAEGCCHILIDVDAESWESCIECDARPRGEEQPAIVSSVAVKYRINT